MRQATHEISIKTRGRGLASVTLDLAWQWGYHAIPALFSPTASCLEGELVDR